MQGLPPEVRCYTLAASIRYMRERAGLSARSLSIKAGLSPSYVGKLESGEIDPSVRNFGRIAIALGFTPYEVYYCVTHEALREEAYDN